MSIHKLLALALPRRTLLGLSSFTIRNTNISLPLGVISFPSRQILPKVVNIKGFNDLIMYQLDYAIDDGVN